MLHHGDVSVLLPAHNWNAPCKCVNHCVNTLLQVNGAHFFNLSTQDCANNPAFAYTNTTDTSSPSYVRPLPFEQQTAAAVGYLLPGMYKYGRIASWYMANASISSNTTSTVSWTHFPAMAVSSGAHLHHCCRRQTAMGLQQGMVDTHSPLKTAQAYRACTALQQH